MSKALGRTPQEERAMRRQISKAKQKEWKYAQKKLVSLIDQNTTIFTRTSFGSGERDYVRAYIAPRANEIIDISYYAATVTNRKMTKHGISVAGLQFHKGHEIACDAWKAAMGDNHPFNQDRNWREIH
jgi:hypothetical protein